MKRNIKILFYLLVFIAGIMGGSFFYFNDANTFYHEFYGDNFYLIILPLIIGILFPLLKTQSKETFLFVSYIFLILGVTLFISILIIQNSFSFFGMFSVLFGAGIYISSKYIKSRLNQYKEE